MKQCYHIYYIFLCVYGVYSLSSDLVNSIKLTIIPYIDKKKIILYMCFVVSSCMPILSNTVFGLHCSLCLLLLCRH